MTTPVSLSQYRLAKSQPCDEWRFEAERCILKAILLDVEFLELMTGEIAGTAQGYFKAEIHADIFSAMVALKGERIDLIAIAEYLRFHKQIDNDGARYIGGMMGY
jgi:replicative DNA helicase